MAYGTANRTFYNPNNPEHQTRRVHTGPEGCSVAGHWSEIVGKVGEPVDVAAGFAVHAKLRHFREFF